MHQRARPFEGDPGSAHGRGAERSAPRPTPLTLVAGAVAGDSLERVAAAVTDALGCPIAIAIPALGEPVVSPARSLDHGEATAIIAYAAAEIEASDAAEAVTADDVATAPRAAPPEVVADAVPIRIAEQVVGVVAAVAHDPAPRTPVDAADRRAWLEAAAAAASVTALIHETHAPDPAGSADALLAELAAGPPSDLPVFLARGRRLGVELGAGGVAVCARRTRPVGSGTAPAVGSGTAPAGPTAPAPGPPADADDARSAADRALIAELQASGVRLIGRRGADRILAVVPLEGGDPTDRLGALTERMRAAGLTVTGSSRRRDPTLLHEAVIEAELLDELTAGTEDPPTGPSQEETFRLLIGVLLRDREELEQLRDRTVWALSDYDAVHDTELVATLKAFLDHDGSTTETAEAMRLHRHTVGYRLSRVHEVSGLSPYGSDGRERLSLGIKAQQIFDAERRRAG